MALNRVLVIGADGMLGHDLMALARDREPLRRLRRVGGAEPVAPGPLVPESVEVAGVDRPEIDITEPDQLAVELDRRDPGVVINVAAYTDVDGAESHRDEAFAVNADGAAHLARWCHQHGRRLLHVSTDFVFDGQRDTPYPEDTPSSPMNAYGESKAEGERRVRQADPQARIVRTSWLFGAHGRNFVKTMLRLSTERDELRVVSDQVGGPTFSRDLAEALWVLAFHSSCGFYHFCNAGSCSWYDFAREIFRQADRTVHVDPITTQELARPAPRPAYSALGVDRFVRESGYAPRPWPEALAECLSDDCFSRRSY